MIMGIPGDIVICFRQRLQLFLLFHWAGIILCVAPLALAPLLLMEPALEYRCAYVVGLMSILWITEALPLCVTSLLPIVLFPIMGILESELVCRAYFSNSLVLFFGSLVMALAIEYCNLHQRVALWVILCVGCSPRRLHLSLMLVTMFISMWLSNSAATSMMCPVVKALLNEMANENMLQLVEQNDINGPTGSGSIGKPSKEVISFYLGVAFAASIGGCGTLFGTGVNISFEGVYHARFPHSHDLNFIPFALFSLPTMLVITIAVYFYLQWLHCGLFRTATSTTTTKTPTPSKTTTTTSRKNLRESTNFEEVTTLVLHKRLNELGSLSCHELQVAILFLIMIIVLVTRHPGNFNGWSQLFPENTVKDSFSVISIVVLLFTLPSNYNFVKMLYNSNPKTTTAKQLQSTPALLSWSFVNANNHWSLLLLTGGGLALAEGIKTSGFAAFIGSSLHGVQNIPASLLQFCCICVAIVLTGFSSNIAMCNIMIPILMEISVSARIHPLYLTMPACLGLNMAFLFPVSTPPNALAATSANISSKDMFIAGIVPTIISLIVIFIASQTLAFYVIPDYDTFPLWARPVANQSN